jgi:hypothetical protein
MGLPTISVIYEHIVNCLGYCLRIYMDNKERLT